MFVRKRGNRWQARVAIKGYPEQVKSFESEASARAWGAGIEQRIQAGGYAHQELMTLAGALKRYLEDVSVTKKGVVQETSLVRRLLADPISDANLAKVRGVDIARYRDQMKAKGYAPATIVRHLALLSNVFTTARREWSVEVGNPVELVKKPIVRNERSRRLSDTEIEAILRASGSRQLRSMIVLALETCMRRGELVGLSWGDLDLFKRVIHLRDTKNGRSRLVPLSRRAIQLLAEMHKERSDTEYVFGISKDSVSQAFERACARSGVLGARFHDLRREGISRLAERGFGIIEVAAVSGHRDLRTLSSRYIRLNIAELAAKLDHAE